MPATARSTETYRSVVETDAQSPSRKDRDAADTHVQCQRALLCSHAARATQVHVSE